MAKKYIVFSMYVVLGLNTLFRHVPDGNIWGIYVDEGHLLIGDFWAACILLYCLWRIIQYIQEYI